MKELISRDRAIAAARKRLSFKRAKDIEEHAEWAGLTMADVFKCGAEEAQCEIIGRLREVPALAEKPKTRRTREQVVKAALADVGLAQETFLAPPDIEVCEHGIPRGPSACPSCHSRETVALCPHGMPLAENVCGPCSKGRPNDRGKVAYLAHIDKAEIHPNRFPSWEELTDVERRRWGRVAQRAEMNRGGDHA